VPRNEAGVVRGIKIYEFYRSKGYTKSFEEFGRVALRPSGEIEPSYVPITVHYSTSYSEQCAKYLIERDGFTMKEFYDWLKANG
jgi:hypothetical protein